MSEPQNTSPIRNTTEAMKDPVEASLFLLDAMAGHPGGIERMEAAGQAQLVNSDRLPTDTGRDGDEAFIALGFTFEEPDPDDPLFRPATLPSGWKRQASDHSMWSYIVDEQGERRVAIFYKAAFYDRRAFMRLGAS
jgi:hypothetical protein